MDFFAAYLKSRRNTEQAWQAHRWSAIALLSTALGGNVWCRFGADRVYPNLFLLFVGESAVQKSGAMQFAQGLLRDTQYDKFAPDSVSKNTFFTSFAKAYKVGDDCDEIVGMPSVMPFAVWADEFTAFAGVNSQEFYTQLGQLWNWNGAYTASAKGKLLRFTDPVVTIFAATTPPNVSRCFPPTTEEQGFPSRNLFVYIGGKRQKVAFPSPIPNEELQDLRRHIRKVMELKGEMVLKLEALKALTTIYERWQPLKANKLQAYSGRRHIHLLKLCQIIAASRLSLEVTLSDVIQATTYLTHTEAYMPMAVGDDTTTADGQFASAVLKALRGLGDKEVKETEFFESLGITGPKVFVRMKEVIEQLRMCGEVETRMSGMTTYYKWIPSYYRQRHNDGLMCDWGLLEKGERG